MKKILLVVAVIVVLLGAGLGVKAAYDKKNENIVSTQPADGRDDAEVADENEVYYLNGQITEITDEYIILEGTEQGTVQVNLFDDTAFGGKFPDEFVVGEYAQVIYDGKMTRSIPPQVTALAVDVCVLEGKVAEILEDGRVLIDRTDVMEQQVDSQMKEDGTVETEAAYTPEQVIVSLPEGVELSVGDNAVFYTTGVSTMSLPAQMNAIGVVKK